MEDELLKIAEDESLTKDERKFKIWEKIYNQKIILQSNQKITNINIPDSILFNNGFVEFLNFYGIKNYPKATKGFITSESTIGNFSINFSNVNVRNYINKYSVSVWCQDSPYYPKSHIIKSRNEYNILQLDENKKYFVKPMIGEGSRNIGVSMGKNMVYRGYLLNEFPLVFQEGVKDLRLNDGRKEDERVYVLFMKYNQKFKIFLHTKTMVRMCKLKYTEEFNKNNHFTINVKWMDGIDKRCKFPCELDKLIPLVQDISRRILPNIETKMSNGHLVEFWLTGWDALFDVNNHPWLLEINPMPNQCESIKARIMHYAIYQEIFEFILALDNGKKYKMKNFIEVKI